MTNWLAIPDYEDTTLFEDTISTLNSKAWIVDVVAINKLKKELSDCFEHGFVLQAGDCAESFAKKSQTTYDDLDLIRQQADLLTSIGPIVTIGRMAGQFAKPRTKTHEANVHSYYGDMINDVTKTVAARRPDPHRMLRAYDKSLEVAKLINNSVYTSHEALLLPYEYAMTRRHLQKNYNIGAHLLWAGVRTNHHSGTHIKYLSEIENPVAVKIGLRITADELIKLIKVLNPANLKGKLILIHRMGVNKTDRLKPLVAKIVDARQNVLWMCDPMHGNTHMYPEKTKVRYIEDIMQEITDTIAIHKQYGSRLHGLHLEQTSLDVNECVTRARKYSYNYQSLMDPRLNPEQALTVVRHTVNAL